MPREFKGMGFKALLKSDIPPREIIKAQIESLKV